MQNVNVVVVTGNLTHDPELRYTGAGTPVAALRVAVNGRRKNAHEEWVDKPNYFNVTVWGKHGEACVEHLAKGRPVAIEGRLDWRAWGEENERREAVQIIANTVQFLPYKAKADGGEDQPVEPIEQPELAAVGTEGFEDEIPF